MAVVTAYALVGVLSNAAPTPDYALGISAFTAVNNSPAQVSEVAISVPLAGSVVSNLPVSELGQAFYSQRAPSFLDDYYNRVHILPSEFALGNLLSSQVRQFEVWSAYLTPKLLSSITTDGTDGITLTQPSVPPTSFAALESRTYTLGISTNGSPIIDAGYTFNFPADAPRLTITGRRVVVWPFMPQTKHRETLEWKTDILPSFNSEQRLALRPAPRQSLAFEFQLTQEEFSLAKAMATQWAHRVYGIPVWAELTRVGALGLGATEILMDTSAADYRADDAIVIWGANDKCIAAENTGILADRIQLKLPLDQAFSNAYVAPMRFARTFSGMQFSREAHHMTTAKGTFQVTANTDLGAAVGYVTYRGKDVLTDRTVLVSDLEERISRSVDVFDNGSGPIAVDIRNNWVTSTKSISFDTLTRSERWAARKWIHARRGRQRGFWLPSWHPDLLLLENVGAASSALTVRPIGYPLYYGVKDIMVQLVSGARIFSRVLGGYTDPAGNEVLSLEAVVGTAFTVAEVEFICFLSHVRFNTDRVEIKHSYAGRASMAIPVLETPE